MMTRAKFCALLVLFGTPVSVGASDLSRADGALSIQSAPDLRQLAEIDGNPATFTDAERRKYALLQQVLGNPLQSPDPAPPPLPVQFAP